MYRKNIYYFISTSILQKKLKGLGNALWSVSAFTVNFDSVFTIKDVGCISILGRVFWSLS